MKKISHALAFAPLCTLLAVASVNANPITMPEHPILQGQLGQQIGQQGGTVSFDQGVTRLRTFIAEREHSGAMSTGRADRLNRMLDRAVAARNQYVAQGRQLTPEQRESLRNRLNSVRVAAGQRLKFY
jgi:hypothetical protein